MNIQPNLSFLPSVQLPLLNFLRQLPRWQCRPIFGQYRHSIERPSGHSHAEDQSNSWLSSEDHNIVDASEYGAMMTANDAPRGTTSRKAMATKRVSFAGDV